ncbi:MAG: hypothetical protein AB8B92_01255 [Gammaproteobacteria bacterium]
MEDQVEEESEDRINAGRGVVKDQNSDSNKNTTIDQEDNVERPDDRARKAGY